MTRDLRATRDRLGLTTAELAKLVGVGYRTAHGWLSGRAVPEPVWRLLEREEDVRSFARAIIGDNPIDAIGKIYGIDRRLDESDDYLKQRIAETLS